MDDATHRERIRRTLAHHAGAAPDAVAVAAASILTWQQVDAQIAPVIGERGVEALFGRCVHVASRSYPWLAVSASDEHCTPAFDALRRCLAGRQPDDAAAASSLLLLTFSALLATMIGESLTDHLLAPVWVPAAPEQENSHE